MVTLIMRIVGGCLIGIVPAIVVRSFFGDWPGVLTWALCGLWLLHKTSMKGA